MFYILGEKSVLIYRYQSASYIAACGSEIAVTDKWDYLIDRIVEMTGCDRVYAIDAASDYFSNDKDKSIK